MSTWVWSVNVNSKNESKMRWTRVRWRMNVVQTESRFIAFIQSQTFFSKISSKRLQESISNDPLKFLSGYIPYWVAVSALPCKYDTANQDDSRSNRERYEHTWTDLHKNPKISHTENTNHFVCFAWISTKVVLGSVCSTDTKKRKSVRKSVMNDYYWKAKQNIVIVGAELKDRLIIIVIVGAELKDRLRTSAKPRFQTYGMVGWCVRPAYVKIIAKRRKFLGV